MSSSSANHERGGGETPVPTPPGSPSTVWASPAAHLAPLSDNEHSPASPTMARPSQTSSSSKQHRRLTSLSAINTRISFGRPLFSPRRSLPAFDKETVTPLDDPPESSPLTAILEGIASAGAAPDNYPSLLADGDVGVLDSANSPIPLTAFESKATDFFRNNRLAVEKSWSDLPAQPDENWKEMVSKLLTDQLHYIDECFKYVVQAAKQARESRETHSLKTLAEESDRAKELRKLRKENKTLAAENADLNLELQDMRDTNRQLQVDLKAREAALADSPAHDGPIDEKRMNLWLEGEATFFVTPQQQGGITDERPSIHDGDSNDDDESIPISSTVTRRRQLKHSLFGTDINPEMLEMMEEFVATRLAESTTTPAQSGEELKQQIEKLQNDLEDEKFQHRLVVEDWERITGEPISLDFYEKAAAREPLQRLDEETKETKKSSADLEDRILQLEKDLVAEKELVLRVQKELDTWKHEFKTVEEARRQRHDLEERNKEQAGYIQLRSEAWRHAEAKEQVWEQSLAELEKDRDDLETKNNQFLERIAELEDHEKLLESQLEEQTDRANQLDAYKRENEGKTDQFIERIEELEDQQRSLETQLQEHQDRIDKLEPEKAAAEADLALITTQLEQLETELADQTNLDAQLAEVKGQLANMESELKAKRLELSESRQRIQEWEQTRTDLEDQLTQFQELQDKEQSLERELADKGDELLAEQLRNVDLLSELRKRTSELQAAQEDLAVQQSNCNDFIQRIEELEDEVKEQQTRTDELKIANSESETMEAQHLATIKGLEAIVARLQAQIEHHSNTISLLMTKPPLSPKRVELLRRQTQTPRDLRKMLLRLTTQRKQYHDRWLKTKQALGVAMEDLARLLVQMDADTERERQLREQIASLEKDLAETSASLMRAMAELAVISKADGPSDEDALDAVDDLPPSPPLTPNHTTSTHSPNRATRNSTDVVHLHAEACFCTLVDYFLPGVLEKMFHELDCTCCDDQGTESYTNDDNDSGYETQFGPLPTEPNQAVPRSETGKSPQSPISSTSQVSDVPPSFQRIQVEPGFEEEDEVSVFDMPLRKVVTDPGPGFGYNHAYDYGVQLVDEGVPFEAYGVHNDDQSKSADYGLEIESTRHGASQADQEGNKSEESEDENYQPAFEETQERPMEGEDIELGDTQLGLSLRGGGSSDAGSSEPENDTADLLFEETQGMTTEDGDEQSLPAVVISTSEEVQPPNQYDYIPATPSRNQGVPSSFPTPMTGTTVFGTEDPDAPKPTFEELHAAVKQGLVATFQVEDPFQVTEDSQTRGHIDNTDSERAHGDYDGKPDSRAAPPLTSHSSDTKPKIHFPPLSTDMIVKKRTTYPKSPAVPKQARKNCACNCHNIRYRRRYHGHTTSLYEPPADLFTREAVAALICRFLTALTWLGLLIFHTPGTFLSTTSILAGYFFLPLGYIFAMGVYSIRQLTYRVMPPFPTFRTTYAPPPISRPNMPIMPRPSAHQIVTSAVFLLVAYNVLASEALIGERITWTTPNRLRTAYAADIIDHRPYPGWSPISADFRFVVRDWCNALIFFRGWMGEFIKEINSIPTVVVHGSNLLGQFTVHGLAILGNTVISAGAQVLPFYKTRIDIIGVRLERSLDWILHILRSPVPIISSWLATMVDWIIQAVLLPFDIIKSLLQKLLIHVDQLAAKHVQSECRGGVMYLGDCVLEYVRDRFDVLGEWLERPLELLDEWRGR